MFKPIGILAFLVMAVSSSTTQAALWDFSYTFNSGKVISGSFTGDAQGDFVENVANISVLFNGFQFEAYPDLFVLGWNFTRQLNDIDVPARISPKLELNNFMFSDAQGVLLSEGFDASNVFQIVNDPAFVTGTLVRTANQVAPTESQGDIDLPGNPSRWLLAPVQIPEPGSITLVGLGLAGMGWSRKRVSPTGTSQGLA